MTRDDDNGVGLSRAAFDAARASRLAHERAFADRLQGVQHQVPVVDADVRPALHFVELEGLLKGLDEHKPIPVPPRKSVDALEWLHAHSGDESKAVAYLREHLDTISGDFRFPCSAPGCSGVSEIPAFCLSSPRLRDSHEPGALHLCPEHRPPRPGSSGFAGRQKGS